tara:strand:+ start:642 stop:1217 length:576 start_codon:yes stop_codon:yes gene_type:complete
MIESWIWKEEIPNRICKKLINLDKGKWKRAHLLDQETQEDTKDLNDIRKSDIVWIREQWVYDLIWPYMTSANEQAGWNYDIVAAENCQLTRYTKNGFYDWHIDGMGSHNEVRNEPDNKFLHGNTRKLSMSIVLNSDFEGGDLEIGVNMDKRLKSERGSIIVFPSFLEHRVTPVTKGTRYSLVSWFLGPPFV